MVVVVLVEYKCLGHLLAVQLLLPQPTVNTMNILSSGCLALVTTILQTLLPLVCIRNGYFASEGNYQRMQILVWNGSSTLLSDLK